MTASVVASAALAALVLGCAAPCDPASSCPTPISIRGACQASRACDVDGQTMWCVTGSCALPRGATLTVPLGGQTLAKTPDLYVEWLNEAGAGAPDPTRVDARLHGEKGKARSTPGRDGGAAALVSWNPLPASPSKLTVRFDDGAKSSVDPSLQLEDGPCEESAGTCFR
ncbi:MAG TPA: hypothetical protein VHB21_27900 [Minicystis sp.]|nr:hypothetical protein [Minicystis sp.]